MGGAVPSYESSAAQLVMNFNQYFRMKTTILPFTLFITLLCGTSLPAQKAITPVLPADKAVNVNTGIIRWSADTGNLFDLYLGTTPDPELYKAGLKEMEEKPVILELNKTYYWKVAENRPGKKPVFSKIFTFSTLPIILNSTIPYSYFVDQRDYTVYATTSIKGMDWFAQNLDFDLKEQSWYYDNTDANKVYGKLYSGHALKTDPGGLCPEGWRIAVEKEWTQLLDAFGGVKTAGSKLKESSVSYWRKSEVTRTNSSGMTLLPAGSRDSKPTFANLGKYATFWTLTPSEETPDSYLTFNLGFMRDNLIRNAGDPNWSYSIRCIRNNP